MNQVKTTAKKSMFSKRHYETIAKEIQEARKGNEDIEQLISRLVNVFRNDNPRFDTTRFENAISTKHYHVIGGISGGYIPNSNTWFDNLQDAKRHLKEMVSIERASGNKFTGSMQKQYYAQTDNNYMYEITDCYEVDCFKEID